MSRVIAVIGTAGRDKTIKMSQRHWDFMYQKLIDEIQPGDTLVSGGAAWADHLAVIAYLDNCVGSLSLHFPAPFNGRRFLGGYGTSGGACNYYHDLFSKAVDDDTLGHLQAALHQGAKLTTQPVATGYVAMAARNKLVAAECTHMIAFTFGEGSVPADGGTKMTWDMAAHASRVHVPIPR